MEAHQLVNQDSGNVERYTDPVIVNAARWVMGGINLDPASSKAANDFSVHADNYFTKEDDGLAQEWSGNVWMNHPFSKGWIACTDECKRKTCVKRGRHVYENIPKNAEWINKLDWSYRVGCVTQAICITYNSSSENWFLPLLRRPQCFPFGRINYYNPDGTIDKGITKGSVITYYGDDVSRFAYGFRDIGITKIPI